MRFRGSLSVLLVTLQVELADLHFHVCLSWTACQVWLQPCPHGPASSLLHSPPSPSNQAGPPASRSLRSCVAVLGCLSPLSGPNSQVPGPVSPRQLPACSGVLCLVGRGLERKDEKQPLFRPAASTIAQVSHPSGPSTSLTSCLILWLHCLNSVFWSC